MLRLLEEVHRLQQQRLAEAQRLRQRGKLRLARDAVEHRIEIVQRMADLVQGQRHRLVGRLLLEEEADGAARLPEVAVARMALVARREDRARRTGIEGRHQLGGARLQGVAVGRRQEVRQHQEAVALVGGEVERSLDDPVA